MLLWDKLFFIHIEEKKNSLTVTLSGHQGTKEGLRGWGQASPLPLYLLADGSAQASSLLLSLLIWNMGPQPPPHSTHEIKGEMLTQAWHRAWHGEKGLGGRSSVMMLAKV